MNKFYNSVYSIASNTPFDQASLPATVGLTLLGSAAQAGVIGGIYGGVSDNMTAWDGIKTVAPYIAGANLANNMVMKNFANNYARGLKALGNKKGMTPYQIGEKGKSLRTSFFSGLSETF